MEAVGSWRRRAVVKPQLACQEAALSRSKPLADILALCAATAVVIATAGASDWDGTQLAIIAVLAIASDLTYVETGSRSLRVSGSFLGIMLAAVLLGGGPAAIVGFLTIAVGWLRSRELGHYLRNNLVTYAWFPLLAGLAFHAAIRVTHVGANDAGYYLLVFGAFVFALALNFIGIAGYQCAIDGTSMLQKVREAVVPILASELFSALLTVAAVYVAVQSGTIGIALFGLVLVVFQYLVSALLLSQQRSEALRRMATTDELTGLPNRESFLARLGELIEATDPSEASLAVMLMDLDHFKEVNDTLGHHYGDVLLRQLGPRLAECVGPDGFVARLGGDEFAVLSGRGLGGETFGVLAERLLECVHQPLDIDELSLEVGASIGIARYPQDGDDPHALLRRADVAMYAAKESQGGYRLYQPEQDRHSVRRLSLVSDVRRALESDEVVVYYQPKVDPRTGRVHGAEALVRWEHPRFGLLTPAAFIGVVEQTELIGPLTRHVLDRAIAQCATWRRENRDLSVAVNLSLRNLLDRDLPQSIERMLAEHGLASDALELELTESMIMTDPDRAMATLTRLSTLGLHLSVDDFGTGYSSLAHLRRFPIDELKIDRSFVTSMLQDESNLIIVRSTINLGHDLGLKVIAEGVEDAATIKRLSRLGCDLAQGYHVSPPLPSAQFDTWLGGDEHVLRSA
jgi:diguanylate cyclase (GGDEF)-like protein